jgi:hypothetical protein
MRRPLGTLQHVDDVAEGDEVFDLEGGQRGTVGVEAVAVALEGGSAWLARLSSRGMGSSSCFCSPT